MQPDQQEPLNPTQPQSVPPTGPNPEPTYPAPLSKPGDTTPPLPQQPYTSPMPPTITDPATTQSMPPSVPNPAVSQPTATPLKAKKHVPRGAMIVAVVVVIFVVLLVILAFNKK